MVKYQQATRVYHTETHLTTDFTMLKSRRNSKSSKEREVILIKPPEADWQPDERWELARRRHNSEKHFRTNNSYHPPRNRE